jgi:hypothetical protein
MSGNDVAEIIALTHLYAMATDTLRWDLFDRIFTPDLDANCPPNGRWVGLEDFKSKWAAFHEILDGSTHTFTNQQVVVSGDTANMLSYVHVRLWRKMPDGKDWYESGGYYDDKLIRTPAGWRIRARLYGGNWWDGNPRVGGEDFDPSLIPLRHAAKAGDVAFVNALGTGATRSLAETQSA